jgi:hypothetical protein
VRTARDIAGLEDIRACSARDVPRDYRRKHPTIFSHHRGDGLWLWKPFLIQKTLQDMQDGDILFYCDAGSHFIGDPAPLFELAASEPEGVISFTLNLLERCYTKRICFAQLGMDRPLYTDTPQRLASFILLRAGEFARRFAAEWLSYCEQEHLLTDSPSPPPLVEYPDFIAHRHDQSLFSLTCKRHEIPGYPDPSQFGDRDPKRPALYPRIIQHTRAMGKRPWRSRIKRFVRRIRGGISQG